MTDFYDATNEREYYDALQRRINDGSIWSFEGSAGRAAMNAIESGLCILGRTPVRDYWGNRIPSRFEVKPRTKGHATYARMNHGVAYYRHISRIK